MVDGKFPLLSSAIHPFNIFFFLIPFFSRSNFLFFEFSDLRKYRTYQGIYVRDLLRALRNKVMYHCFVISPFLSDSAVKITQC